MATIDEISRKDYPRLASFLNSYWQNGIESWLERFLFLWDKNPAFSEDPIRGAIVKDNNRIEGFIGKFPVKYQFNGLETTSSNGIGLLLDPSLRGTGLGKCLKDKHTELSKGKFIFATSPNKISQKINKSIGFKALPRGIGNYNIYSLMPVRISSSLKLLFLLSKQSKSLAPFSVTGHNLSILKHRGRQLIEYGKRHTKTVKIIRAGAEFDRFWTETRQLYQNTNVRNSEVINWYLVPTQHADREVYANYYQNKLMGFIVVRPTFLNGIWIMLCVDFWIGQDNCRNTIANLLTFAKRQAKKKKYGAVLVPHFSKAISNDLDAIGLLKMIGAKRNDLYLKPDNSEAAITELNSYFTYMNGDRFLGRFAI